LHGTPETAVRAEYWFVSPRGQFKRIGYSVTPAVLAHIGGTPQSMVQGIEAGVFPPHPTAQSTSIRVECPYCDPDGMGVAELRRQYDHKQADAAMDAFVHFAHPLEDIAVDTE